MQFVLIIYHGTSPLPGSDAWKAMPAAEHKAIYAEYAELNNNPGITFRLRHLRRTRRRPYTLKTARWWSKTGRMRQKALAEHSCSMPKIWMRRSQWPARFRRPVWEARWRSGQSKGTFSPCTGVAADSTDLRADGTT